MFLLRVLRPSEHVGTAFEVPAGRPLTIGRTAESELCVPSAAMSRKHATIELVDPTHARVRDLGSSGGSWVRKAGRPRAERDVGSGILVGPGDRILLGDAELEVVESGG